MLGKFVVLFVIVGVANAGFLKHFKPTVVVEPEVIVQPPVVQKVIQPIVQRVETPIVHRVETPIVHRVETPVVHKTIVEHHQPEIRVVHAAPVVRTVHAAPTFVRHAPIVAVRAGYTHGLRYASGW